MFAGVGPVQVEASRTREPDRIPVGRAEQYQKPRASRDRLAAEFHFPGRRASHALDRRAVTQSLLNHGRPQRRLPAQPVGQTGVAREQQHHAADKRGQCLVPADQQLGQDPDRLVARQDRPAPIGGLHQHANKVARSRIATPGGDQPREEVVELRRAARQSYPLVGRQPGHVQPHSVVGPLLQPLLTAGIDPEDVANHGQWQRDGQPLHDVRPAIGGETFDQPRADRSNIGLIHRDRLRGQHLLGGPADARVRRRVAIGQRVKVFRARVRNRAAQGREVPFGRLGRRRGIGCRVTDDRQHLIVPGYRPRAQGAQVNRPPAILSLLPRGIRIGKVSGVVRIQGGELDVTHRRRSLVWWR